MVTPLAQRNTHRPYQSTRMAGAISGFKYTSYLFGNGATGYAEATGEGGSKKPVEIDSVAAAGNGEGVETVWYRRHWVMHPAALPSPARRRRLPA